MRRSLGGAAGFAAVLASFVPSLCAPLQAQRPAQRPAYHRGVQADTLDDIVVTVSRTSEATRSLTASVTTIDRTDLEQTFAGTADRALQDVPGVNIVGDGTYGQEIRLNVRGMNSGFGTQRTLVLLDGRPLTDEYLGHVDLAAFPTTSLERLELVRGPASAAYGSNAMGGVLNLMPLRGDGPPRAELAILGGSYGNLAPSGYYGQRIGRVDALVSGSMQSTDGYLRNSRGMRMDWDGRNGFLNLGMSGNVVSARVYGVLFDGQSTDEDYRRDLTRTSQDLAVEVRQDASRAAVLDVRLWHSSLHQTQRWFDAPTSTWRQRTLGTIVTQRYGAGSLLSLLAGVELRRLEARTTDVGTVDRHSTLWGVFVQDRLALSQRVTALIGLRGDGRPSGGIEPSFRIGVNAIAGARTTLIGAVGRAFRVPTISDRFLPRTSFFGLEFEGNPDLDPESSLSGELGVRQRLGGRVELAVTGFVTSARDFWDFLPSNDGVLRPQNIARVNIRGFETELRAPLSHGFDLMAGYTFTDARYRGFAGSEDAVGHRIDDNVQHTVAGSIMWSTKRGDAVRFVLRGLGDRVTDPLDPPNSRLPGFTVADLTAVVPVSPTLRLNAGISNLFDREYRVRPEFPQPGRALMAGATLGWYGHGP